MAITKIQSESLNLADTYAFTGTVTGAGESNTPAFHAKFGDAKTQSGIASSTDTKVTFETEVYDTANAYDNSTNYRFTVPSGQAGKYYFYAQVRNNSATDHDVYALRLFKNGSAINQYMKHNRRQDSIMLVVTDDASVGDYYEIYVNGNNTFTLSDENYGNGATNYFGGFKIID